MIKLSDILKNRGIFSNEIKQRFQNRQISINGDVIESDVELDIDFWNNFIECGDFIFDVLAKNEIWLLRTKLIGLDVLMNSECNIKNDLTEFLKDFVFIRTSKKEAFLLKRKII